ncbi:MAG: phosphoribosylformylglycinamidine synthase subunit PurL [Chloroflexi bacterium]|nr:phosphoribosylformylglycinamidine synthase subunit PurL [Chloroflexota bacterium]
MPIPKQALDEVALNEKEYGLIVERLGREPNLLELGMFGSLWSEHCGYKHSRPLLSLLPSTSPRVLVPPGQENAGVVDIGHGLSVAFKMESHNHPSAIEPYQGAATGVGGIVRDVFAMGARPIALLNSLRFGPLSDPRNRYLFQGVVAGISGYGNCIGVPDVGGEIAIAPCYSGNPLVNAMCVGLLEEGRLVRAAASTPGNTLMLAGADTGRDGIHGASGLASRTFEEERELRPTVQVGNPFLEKVLIEACLEVARTDLIEGMQDLGAAGLTSSAVECAARGGCGLEIDVAQVPRREGGMTPYEVMLSESQERMLLIVKQGREEEVKGLFQKWDVPCVVVGRVTADGMARIYDGPKQVAEVPVRLLNEPPRYRLQAPKPAWLEALQQAPLSQIPLPDTDAGTVLRRLLASPGIAAKGWVFRQYDHEVQTNTVVKPGQADAAVLRLRATSLGLALCTDGNGRLCYLDPYQGGAMAVAEACRNLACTGATPVAITDCLNLGNPERPDVYYQLEQCIEGMAEACRVLDVPVVSGNVSLYNETRGEAIYPTPVIGAVGVLENVERRCTAAFQRPGDAVVLLGARRIATDPSSLAGSEYLDLIHGRVEGQPTIDLAAEARLQRCLVSLVRLGLLSSAHDCSDGGLAVALAESCILGGTGFRGSFSGKGRWDAALFGETPSRVVVSLAQGHLSSLALVSGQEGVPFTMLGTVIGDGRFIVPGLIDVPVPELADAYNHALERALTGAAPS